MVGAWSIQTLNQNTIVAEVPDLAASNKKNVIRVLHVDDDPSMLEISKRILTDMDGKFDIDNACCVDEAFKRLAIYHYDVVVSDNEMPQKDGLQFLNELRKQNNKIPFILFTEKGREEVAIKALNLGADGYYNKQGTPETVYGELIYGIRQSVERKNAKTKAKTCCEEKRLRAILDSSPDAITICDLNAKIVDCNEATLKQGGYTSRRQIIGKNGLEFIAEKDQPKAIEAMTRLISQGTIPKVEITCLKLNGEEYPAELTVGLLKNTAGNPEGLVGVLRDISERKKAEDLRKILETKVDNYSKHLKYMVDLRTAQLKDANARLVKSERLAAIGELAGMVGHDLRNPLAGIKNAAYFLKKKGTAISEPQAKEMLEIIDKAIDHSDKIINDLLDYSREMHLELTKYSAHTLVDEAIHMIKVPERIQIVNNVYEETLIWVNPDKIMRVFINLIKNAIDAMPQKGTLTITNRQTKDNVEIAFADTGKGIPEKTLPKLFSPLFTTKAQGMGFGLAICKRIMDAHGGTITVETTVNKGTTFTITLPVKSKEPTLPKDQI